MNINGMIHIIGANWLIRLLLWFCPVKTEALDGWHCRIEYKVFFGRTYFIRAYFNIGTKCIFPF